MTHGGEIVCPTRSHVTYEPKLFYRRSFVSRQFPRHFVLIALRPIHQQLTRLWRKKIFREKSNQVCQQLQSYLEKKYLLNKF